MQKLLKFSLFLFVLLSLSCDKDAPLTTLADFIGKDDSNPDLRREYKFWVLNKSTITIPGEVPIVYKKGEAIQRNYDPSKLSFLFKSDGTYDKTDTDGSVTQGYWQVDTDKKKLNISSGLFKDAFSIIQATRTNLDLENTESIDGKSVKVTLDFKPQ